MSIYLLNDRIFSLSAMYIFIYGLNLLILLILSNNTFFSLKSLYALFNKLSIYCFYKPFFVISVLSLLGLPPVSGFVLKFNFFTTIFYKGTLTNIFLFFFYTILSLFLYLKLLKFNRDHKLTKPLFKKLLKKTTHIYLITLFLIIISFFNLFFLIFFKDFFLCLLGICFMATLAQRRHNYKHYIYHRPKHPALRGSPQRRGIGIRLRICTPRKPNSARRPVIKLFLSTKRKTIAHIPGSGHTLRRHSKLLISGQGPRDLPGVNYTCIRGVLDFEPMYSKKKRRSIYGVSMPTEQKTHVRRKLREMIKK